MAYWWIFMELTKVVLWIYLLVGNICPQVLDIAFKSESFEKVSSNQDQPNIFNKAT